METKEVRKRLLPAVIVGVIILAGSCQHDPDYTLFIEASTSVSSNCNPDTVYFDNDIMPLLTSNCGVPGCHNTNTKEEGISVASYSDILNSKLVVPGRPDKSEIMEVITETDPKDMMPPPPRNKLTADQVAQIEKWIRQGARNNKCIGGCNTNEFKFAANVMPIITLSCKGCHSGTFPSGNVGLNNYGEVKTQVDNGNLSGTINHKAGNNPMPLGGKLPDCELTIINKWIQAGALNN